MADPTSNSYFTVTVFIFIWSDILLIRSNAMLSNRALTHSDFIRYNEWLRYVSAVNDMIQLISANLSFNHLKMIKSCSFRRFLSHFFMFL